MLLGRVPARAKLRVFVEIEQDPPIPGGRTLELAHKEFRSETWPILRAGMPCGRLPMDKTHRVIRLHLTRMGCVDGFLQGMTTRLAFSCPATRQDLKPRQRQHRWHDSQCR